MPGMALLLKPEIFNQLRQINKSTPYTETAIRSGMSFGYWFNSCSVSEGQIIEIFQFDL